MPDLLVGGERMLSRGKIRAGSARYYVEQVASGVEDYMTGAGEAPGRWDGSGARHEGLAGIVAPEQVERLFEGQDAEHPLTGELLGRRYTVRTGNDKVMGWDLTLSAPKSFSVLWAVGDPDVAKVLDEVHAAAVRETIAYLEDHAAFARTGHAGVAQVDTNGLVVARFEHRTSRAMDPQRHSHLLVSNRVRCLDGVWRSLDSKALHPQLKPAGTVYHAALRAEATARLGLVWGEVNEHGQADIVDVPDELVEFWSKRRRTVEHAASRMIGEREAELGRRLTDAERREIYQQATLATRQAKNRTEALPENIHDIWRLEAQAAGHPVDDWYPSVFAARQATITVDEDRVIVAVIGELERSRSTWDRTDVVEHVAARLPVSAAGDASEARRRVEELADSVLAHPHVVRLAAEPLPPAAGLSRRDGRSVFEPHNATRFTTNFTLGLEQDVLVAAINGQHAGRAVVDEYDVEEAVDLHGLSGDQAKAVERMCRGGEAIVCLVGPAGTGKTRTVGAAAMAWADHPVRGLAVSAVAADVLAHEARIPADTVAKFLHEHDRPDGPGWRWRLQWGEIVVVDEASQLATVDLWRLVQLVEQASGKLVLVGDHRQLGAVDAGGVFRLLVNDTPAAELTGVHRFAHAWEREATIALRRRDTRVLDDYEAHHRLRAGSRDDMVDIAYRASLDARTKGVSMLVMAAEHTTVDELAMRIRAGRVAAGQVEPGGLEVGDQTIGAGDEIVTLHNDRRLVTSNQHWVRNGDRWRVERRNRRGGLHLVSLDDRGRVYLPPAYAAEHVALAYAVTLHKAQGMTVDHGLVIADDRLSELGLYVGLTRGRHANHALVITEGREEHLPRMAPERTAKDVLAGVLQRDTAERSATEALRSMLTPESYERMSTQLEHVIKSIIRNAGPTASAQEAWLEEHRDVRDLHDIIRTALDNHPVRTSETTWQPPQPAEPDLGLEL